MFALWIEVLLLNLAAFLIGLGIAWLIWGREAGR
jgi:hypothetical protein